MIRGSPRVVVPPSLEGSAYGLLYQSKPGRVDGLAVRLIQDTMVPTARTGVRSCGDVWFRQGLVDSEREPRCRQASLNRRQNEVTANKQSTLALAA